MASNIIYKIKYQKSYSLAAVALEEKVSWAETTRFVWPLMSVVLEGANAGRLGVLKPLLCTPVQLRYDE